MIPSKQSLKQRIRKAREQSAKEHEKNIQKILKQMMKNGKYIANEDASLQQFVRKLNNIQKK